jgi:hypothetical protein
MAKAVPRRIGQVGVATRDPAQLNTFLSGGGGAPFITDAFSLRDQHLRGGFAGEVGDYRITYHRITRRAFNRWTQLHFSRWTTFRCHFGFTHDEHL